MNTTVSSAQSASPVRANVRPRHCIAPAWNTSKCGPSMSAHSIRSASIRINCGFSKRSWRCACCAESAPISRGEQEALDANHLKVARRGREPNLALNRDGRDVAMTEWAAELLDSMQGLCELLDHGEPTKPYSSALEQQRAKIEGRRAHPHRRACWRKCAAPASRFSSWRCACRICIRIISWAYIPPNESRLAEFAHAAEESPQGAAQHRDLG